MTAFEKIKAGLDDALADAQMTPLEKAARAVEQAIDEACESPDINTGIHIARAVLMAVREPDDDLLNAIQCAPWSDKVKAATNSFDRMNASTEALWQAGIDAILAEKAK